MILEDYGEWTEIITKDGISEWLPNHLHFEEEHKLFIKGYAHFQNGKVIKKFWDYGKLGWYINELIGMGVVNPRSVGKIKCK